MMAGGRIITAMRWVTGQHFVTSRTARMLTGRHASARTARRIRTRATEAIIFGALVLPGEGGVANWQPPSVSPDTGLFYTPENYGFNLLDLTNAALAARCGRQGSDPGRHRSNRVDGHRLLDR
jgi:hypothetical protein